MRMALFIFKVFFFQGLRGRQERYHISSGFCKLSSKLLHGIFIGSNLHAGKAENDKCKAGIECTGGNSNNI